MNKHVRLAALVMAALVISSFAAGCKNAQGREGIKRIDIEGGSFTDVMPDVLDEMLRKKDFILVNVHVPYQGEIPGTDLFLPYDQIEQQTAGLSNKNARIVLYCVSGYMSAIAARTMIRLGYKDIWNLHGGLQMWQEYGFPLVQKP